MSKVEHLENNSITEKFEKFLNSEGKKIIQWALVSIALILSLIYFFFIKEEKKNPTSDLDAAYFTLTHSSKEEIPQNFKNFELALVSKPEMAPNYQGRAAQELIDLSQPELAEKLLNPVFARAQLERFPHYQSFSEITLLIAQNQLQGALDASKSLQVNATGLLAAHNLVRIALLEKLLNNDEFPSTIQTISDILYNKTTSQIFTKDDLLKAMQIYQYKSLGLMQYFEARS